jgi:hypothetical protein
MMMMMMMMMIIIIFINCTWVVTRWQMQATSAKFGVNEG